LRPGRRLSTRTQGRSNREDGRTGALPLTVQTRSCIDRTCSSFRTIIRWRSISPPTGWEVANVQDTAGRWKIARRDADARTDRGYQPPSSRKPTSAVERHFAIEYVGADITAAAKKCWAAGAAVLQHFTVGKRSCPATQPRPLPGSHFDIGCEGTFDIAWYLGQHPKLQPLRRHGWMPEQLQVACESGNRLGGCRCQALHSTGNAGQ